VIDREHLRRLMQREQETFVKSHPRSRAAAEQAHRHLLGGVPMTWMTRWPGGFPLTMATAHAATVTDVDGNEYADFCLGDTGAMAGHSPAATVSAIRHRVETLGGLTTMLPSEDAAWVGAELARRFTLPYWSFTLTATDANRWAIRIARHLTGRPRILVFNHCYHGSVDETVATLADGVTVSRPGNVGPPVDLSETTRVVEFNDVAGVDRELAYGDVAAVLTEPALTNIGIVLPDAGFLEYLRGATRRAGSLLIIDETHTLSAGPGGCTQAWGLDPDVVTVGKAIAGGVPAGAYGLSADLATRISAATDADLVDVGGVGGTLSGNPLSSAAMRATLEQVLTDEAFEHMSSLAARYEAGVHEVLEKTQLPWTITRLGARAEFRFCPQPPRSGAESAAATDEELDEYLHLYLINRGVLLTPFHNMALTCPATTTEQVDRLITAFTDGVQELASG
jgi:glutamate-1-semialdehyde 2,1-aminomutase